MAEVAKIAARRLPGFRLGRKQVFLPSHVITFLRKDHQPPNEASFKVPLTFNKFDLRDYLWNLYNVEVRKVRSYVKSQPLTRRDAYSNSWYRPQAEKIMTVELAQPFQWPEAPQNLEPWNKELWDAREEKQSQQMDEQYDQIKNRIPLKSRQPLSTDRKNLAELAKKMLAGEVKWKNDIQLDPKWHEAPSAQGSKTEGANSSKVDVEMEDNIPEPK